MTSLTTMTWNVENLFRADANAPQAAQHAYPQKLARLARVVNQHTPDVVGLQEVGGELPSDDLYANALLKNNANTRLLLLGDVNDVPEAQTSIILAGPSGSELGTRGFNQENQPARTE
jgi:endonuclease/exonuclease/phosphatase family metal-dependent hydrolase